MSAKEKLCKALIYLMEKQDFEKISVTSICRAAGVNRSTFYNYYSNQIELLEASHAYLTELFHQSIPKVEGQVTDPFSKKVLLPYLEFIKKYYRLYLVYDQHAKEYKHRDAFENLVEKIFTPLYFSQGIRDKREIEYLSAFYMAGIQTVIRKWSRTGFQESVDEIAEILQKCIKPVS